MDEDVIDAIAALPQAVWHPVLVTCREEIAAACRSPEDNWPLCRFEGEELAQVVEACAEDMIEWIASKVGDCLMEGAEYWSALPLAAERVLAS